MTFRPGTRVCILAPTPDDGSPLLPVGTVVYARMAPPTYSVPEVYSVSLDWRADEAARLGHTYTGTIFPASSVVRLVETTTIQESA